MKLNNDLVVFDLEATSNRETADDCPEEQTNDFIIDIGAVLLSRELEIIDRFESLVCPEEPLTPFITGLTGITQAMVGQAPKWDVVAGRFEEWLKQRVRNINNVRLMPWGSYFDMTLLRKVYAYYGSPFPFSGTAIDVKTVAFEWCSLSGRRTDKLSVSHVANIMEIEPEGPYHRAIVDAVVQAKIYIRAKRDLANGYFLPNNGGKPYRYIRIVAG